MNRVVASSCRSLHCGLQCIGGCKETKLTEDWHLNMFQPAGSPVGFAAGRLQGLCAGSCHTERRGRPHHGDVIQAVTAVEDDALFGQCFGQVFCGLGLARACRVNSQKGEVVATALIAAALVATALVATVFLLTHMQCEAAQCCRCACARMETLFQAHLQGPLVLRPGSGAVHSSESCSTCKG